jgi:ATP-dependent Clp protease ATP-binding subunit ClpC
MLLQILEDGRLSDAKGKVVNFANTLIIMTSNLGMRDINQAQTALGFQASLAAEETEADRRHQIMKGKIEEELKRLFRPEFLNRVEAVVTFKPLTPSQVREIVDLLLARLRKHLDEQQVTITVTDGAKDKLAEEGFDKAFGARPLRRVITQRIEDQLSEELLRGRFARGDSVEIDVDPEGGFTYNVKPKPKDKDDKEPAASGTAGAANGD